MTPTPTLAELTAIRVGGPAARFVEAATTDALIAAVVDADDAGEPVLILGSGSVEPVIRHQQVAS